MINYTIVPYLLVLAAPVIQDAEGEQRYPIRKRVTECYQMRIVEGDKVVRIVRGDGTSKAEERERKAINATIKQVKEWEDMGFVHKVGANRWTERTIILSPVFERGLGDGWVSHLEASARDEDSKGPGYPEYFPSQILRIMYQKKRFCGFNRQSWDVGATTSREWIHGDPAKGVARYQGDGTIEIVGHPGINIWGNIIPRQQVRGRFRTHDLVLLSSTLLHEAVHLIAPRNDTTTQDLGRYELDCYRIENLALYRYYDGVVRDSKDSPGEKTRETIELQVRTINQKLRDMCRTQFLELPDGSWEKIDCGCSSQGRLSDCDYCSSQLVLSGPPPGPGEWGNISWLEDEEGRGNLSDYRCDRVLGRD